MNWNTSSIGIDIFHCGYWTLLVTKHDDGRTCVSYLSYKLVQMVISRTHNLKPRLMIGSYQLLQAPRSNSWPPIAAGFQKPQGCAKDLMLLLWGKHTQVLGECFVRVSISCCGWCLGTELWLSSLKPSLIIQQWLSFTVLADHTGLRTLVLTKDTWHTHQQA